jgi:hypothetical protein
MGEIYLGELTNRKACRGGMKIYTRSLALLTADTHIREGGFRGLAGFLRSSVSAELGVPPTGI